MERMYTLMIKSVIARSVALPSGRTDGQTDRQTDRKTDHIHTYVAHEYVCTLIYIHMAYIHTYSSHIDPLVSHSLRYTRILKKMSLTLEWGLCVPILNRISILRRYTPGYSKTCHSRSSEVLCVPILNRISILRRYTPGYSKTCHSRWSGVLCVPIWNGRSD